MREELAKSVEQAYAHDGLSLIHVPVYHGEHEAGGMGWNVGNWCADVEQDCAATLI